MSDDLQSPPLKLYITVAANTLRLEVGEEQDLTVTVTASQESAPGTVPGVSPPVPDGHRYRARVLVKSASESGWHELPWATINANELERDIAPSETTQFTVHVAPSPEVSAGNYALRLDMIGVENPDEDLTEGQSVALEVTGQHALRPQKPSFPWWIIFISVGVLLAVTGAIAYLFVPRQEPPVVAKCPAGTNTRSNDQVTNTYRYNALVFDFDITYQSCAWAQVAPASLPAKDVKVIDAALSATYDSKGTHYKVDAYNDASVAVAKAGTSGYTACEAASYTSSASTDGVLNAAKTICVRTHQGYVSAMSVKIQSGMTARGMTAPPGLMRADYITWSGQQSLSWNIILLAVGLLLGISLVVAGLATRFQPWRQRAHPVAASIDGHVSQPPQHTPRFRFALLRLPFHSRKERR